MDCRLSFVPWFLCIYAGVHTLSVPGVFAGQGAGVDEWAFWFVVKSFPDDHESWLGDPEPMWQRGLVQPSSDPAAVDRLRRTRISGWGCSGAAGRLLRLKREPGGAVA